MEVVDLVTVRELPDEMLPHCMQAKSARPASSGQSHRGQFSLALQRRAAAIAVPKNEVPMGCICEIAGLCLLTWSCHNSEERSDRNTKTSQSNAHVQSSSEPFQHITPVLVDITLDRSRKA